MLGRDDHPGRRPARATVRGRLARRRRGFGPIRETICRATRSSGRPRCSRCCAPIWSCGWRRASACPVEWYRDRYPELDGESLVALLYEEYCLREEAGESPDAGRVRRPVPRRRRLVPRGPRDPRPDRAGPDEHLHRASRRNGAVRSRRPAQTIAGFRLVEELGRGAFARVFLAEEQHLADRPVALKVTRTGSREPQTLARLQHTHIVPVYSYRTDPATGLHLLCMPYLGRVTLSQILLDPAIRSARSGADLSGCWTASQPPEGRRGTIAPRAAQALGRRTYARAIAWWGARMAEALEHAHDRGVLHRDVKPSNVLVTGDGLPMLLDFNSRARSRIDDPEAATARVGGTLAYMAPEHLQALAEGLPDHVDARSDLYALGVVLFDCLVRVTGALALPSTCSTLAEGLQKTVEARRVWPVRLCAAHPDVPAALEAVVNRCLAPEPTDRYASAAELAADLQAVADDAPLRTAGADSQPIGPLAPPKSPPLGGGCGRGRATLSRAGNRHLYVDHRPTRRDSAPGGGEF